MDPEATTSYLDYAYAASPNPDVKENILCVSYKSLLFPIFYATVFLIGVLGNLVLMTALHIKRRDRRLIDIFIINLAISDFIFLITLPLWVDKEASCGQWRTGSVLCKGSSYMISVNMHCTVFLLTCMSVDRYLAIMCPVLSRKFRKRECAYGLCASIWFLSCLLGLPTLLSRELIFINDKPYCAEKRKHNKKLRKSIKVIFIVVAAFVFSWLPFNTFKLLAIVSGLQQELSLSSAVLQLGMEVSGPFAFANSCVNPVIYYIFDNYIHRAIGHVLCPFLKQSDFGSSTETSDNHLTKVFSNFVHSEDFVRRRKRSVSL
ncbi:PREDICTED: G-protein coupled receptor 15-like [Condylura cristata]|uniref:G-protein coupled receptor 15-like n=1 Tax=Condylura cristata TaxID=143302 RepID=UPI000334323E|nr:PREDICTED: G-protein coupled receptor 15-like [Condylura cristata]